MDTKINRCNEVYNFIVQYFKTNLCSPTYRDICNGVNLASTSSVAAYINKLEEYGLVKSKQGRISLIGYDIVKTKDASFYIIR